MSEQIREWAAKYLDRRWAPVVLDHATKKPARTGWLDTRMKVEDLFFQFPDPYLWSIGLLTGAGSNGLVGVDLDSEPAVKLGPSMLPPTGLIRGRPNSARKVLFYQVTDEPPRGKFLKGLELKGTGQQVVVPPSIHTSGVPYQWDQWGEPALISSQELVDSYLALWDKIQPPSEAGTGEKGTRGASVPQGPRPPFLLRLRDLTLYMQDRIWKLLRWRGENKPSISGKGGSAALTSVAVLLIRGFCLKQEAGAYYLLKWNLKYAQPEWDDDEVLQRLEYADTESIAPWGKYLIKSECPDSLSKRAKQLRQLLMAPAGGR
jgi:hypothetical protein